MQNRLSQTWQNVLPVMMLSEPVTTEQCVGLGQLLSPICIRNLLFGCMFMSIGRTLIFRASLKQRQTHQQFFVKRSTMKRSAVVPIIFFPCIHAFAPDFSTRNVVPYIKGSPPIGTSSDDIGITFDYESLFGQIQEASPLAKMVMQESDPEVRRRGLGAVADGTKSPLKWKTVEQKKRGPVLHVEKCDNYNNVKAPLLRFRSEMEGPCNGEFFGKYILDYESRKKWDSQIANVYEMHQIQDLDPVNIAMGFGRPYGDLTRMGIGYAQTKAGFGVSPREQMFQYGMQDFPDGSCVLWGAELDDEYNHLLPQGTRHTRARSHLFSATLTPTGENKFDVEYVLQLEIGGGVPNFLTTPVVVDTVKSLFTTAKAEFAGQGDELESFMAQQEGRDFVGERQGLLMTF